jgi:hypothetical protein
VAHDLEQPHAPGHEEGGPAPSDTPPGGAQSTGATATTGPHRTVHARDETTELRIRRGAQPRPD